MFLIVGIGWAKPVPINPNNFKNTKKGIVAVSLAGVCANFILAFVAFWLLIFELKFINFTDSSSVLLEGIGYLFFRFFLYSVFINVSLIAFNLLPISPLDGFRLVAAFAPNSKFTYFMSRYGSFILLGIIIIGSIIPAADILGMYISWVQYLVYKLIALVLG
jgi:Zn-dependent protease